MSTDEFHRLLLEMSGSRKRVELDLLLKIFGMIRPELAASVTARSALRRMIDFLEAENRIGTPKSKRGWDRSARPSLPQWVLLVRASLESPSEKDIRSVAWAPELRFLGATRLNVPLSDLLKMQKFFADGGRTRCDVPMKERSAQIFGNEKRLDELYRGSALFGIGRLSLESLRCFPVPEPIPWARGKSCEAPLLIVENAATWDSYRRWNEAKDYFSGVVYGGGNRFIDSVLWLREILTDLGGMRPVLYFGDLDPAGLRIPQLAGTRAVAFGLPAIEPDLWSYSRLFAQAEANGENANCEDGDFEDDDCIWLGSLADQARGILSAGKRIPQERLGWEFLRNATRS
jgi:hypothetical protein